MDPNEEPKKRARKKGPKTRSGCKTCKARRVKCDERKPGCLRCEVFGQPCGGYGFLNQVTWVPQQQPKRRLAPGTRLPFEFRFEDGREEVYFRLFCEETVGVLEGGGVLWKTLILQASHTEPSILHFTTSLSALDLACRRDKAPGSDSPSQHHRYALQKYHKAVTGIQHVLSTRQDSLRIALIAALLIFAFENFHGDIASAARSTKGAVDCLYAWLEQTPRRSQGLSPRPNALEDELVGLWCRLGRLLVIYSKMHGSVPNAPGLAVWNRDLNPAATDLRAPAARFKDLGEARMYWGFLAEYTYQFMMRARGAVEPLGEAEEKEVEEQRGKIAGALDGWKKAFEPLLKRSWTEEGEKDFIPVTTMHISCLMRIIDIERERLRKSSHTAEQIDFLVLPEYATVVSLCRRVVAHPGFVKGFVLEFGILSDLFIVAVKCRDGFLRGNAVKLLRMARPRREAFWDSGVLADMAEGVIRAEEGELEGPIEEVQTGEEIGEGVPGWEPEERRGSTKWDELRQFARR